MVAAKPIFAQPNLCCRSATEKRPSYLRRCAMTLRALTFAVMPKLFAPDNRRRRRPWRMAVTLLRSISSKISNRKLPHDERLYAHRRKVATRSEDGARGLRLRDWTRFYD